MGSVLYIFLKALLLGSVRQISVTSFNKQGPLDYNYSSVSEIFGEEKKNIV